MINFRLIAEEKKINFRLASELKSIYAWIDRDKFEKIFFNLISNAFKYTPAEKAITIEVTKQTDKVTISVVDEGIGIERLNCVLCSSASKHWHSRICSNRLPASVCHW